MALLPIRIYPDPVLTLTAAPVTEFDADLETLIEDLAETMYVGEGIGLAAPQVGVSKRLLVMDVGELDPEGAQLRAFINPEIIDEAGTIIWEEGCLSFPGLTVEVERSDWIRVRALDAHGDGFEIAGEGLWAVCVQHEMDHLDGTTIVDRISRLRRKMALNRWRKLRAELEPQPKL